MQVKGRNVVITGGSQGIGERLAERFAASGARVLVIARSEARLIEVTRRTGGEFLVADLGDEEQVDGVVERCIEKLGSVDVFVNNAGMETDDAFVHLDRADIRRVARLNFEAPLMLTRDVVVHMLRRGSGHIVQMSSVAGSIPFPAMATYAGTKAGLTNFAETLRIELRGTGIGLTVVAPGPVDTPMWDRLETGLPTYGQPALDRFRRLGFLPVVSPEGIAKATVRAVQHDRRFVRRPRRFAVYHMLNNAPRRLVEAALIGVKLPPLRVDDEP